MMRLFNFIICIILFIISFLNAIGTIEIDECGCTNFGKCIKTFNSSKCDCISGYQGDKCQYQQIEINNQCLNNGKTLKNIITNEQQCQCSPKHHGALCEMPLCLDYCYNGGKCSLQNNSNTNYKSIPKCTCNSKRFYGDKCQFDSCLSRNGNMKCPENCYLDLNCTCKCGYECDKEYCNRNNGTCVDINGSVGCKCRPGYSGPTCRINDCKGRCFNNGECVRTENNYYCKCTRNYSGERCAKKCSTNSSEFIKPNKSLSINLKSVVLGFSIALILCFLSIALYYIVKFKFVCKFYDSCVNNSFKFNRFGRNDSGDGNDGRNNLDETYSNNTTNNARTNVVRFARESHDSVGFTNLIDYADRDSSV